MTNKKFRSVGANAVLNSLKSGLQIIFPLITYPYAYRILHAEGMGKVNYSASIVSYFSLIATLGITTYAVREGAKIRSDYKKFGEFTNEIFSLNVVTTLIAYLIMGICLIIITPLKEYSWLILLQSLSIAFTTIGVEWINTIYEDFLYITIRSIITQIISLILLFVLVRDANDYYLYAFLTVITNGIICVSNWIYCRRYVHIQLIKNINIKLHLKPILVFFANTVAATIYVNSDITILGLLCGNTTVGIYSLCVKVYSVIKGMLVAIYVVAIPRISFFAGQKDNLSIRDIYTNLIRNIILILLPASVGLIMVSKEIILIIGGSEYINATHTLQILSISLIGAILGGSVTYCLNIPFGNEKINLKATTISAIINISLNFIMIPLFKQNGAAITTVISEFFVFFYCIYNFKDFKSYIDFNSLKKNAIHAGIGCFFIIIVSVLINKAELGTIISLISIILISALGYIVELILLRNEAAILLINKILKN